MAIVDPQSSHGPSSGAVDMISEHLRRLRDTAGNPTIDSIAKRAHCSTGAVSNALNGKAVPTDQVGASIVRSLGGEPDEEWQGLLERARSERDAKQGSELQPAGLTSRWNGLSRRSRILVITGLATATIAAVLASVYMMTSGRPAPNGAGPWPFTVDGAGPLGLIVRTSGERPGIQIGSAAETQTVWVECMATTTFDPRPDTGSGPRWFRIRWPSTQPGKTFMSSSPGDVDRAWVYAGFVLPDGHNGQVPTCRP